MQCQAHLDGKVKSHVCATCQNGENRPPFFPPHDPSAFFGMFVSLSLQRIVLTRPFMWLQNCNCPRILTTANENTLRLYLNREYMENL